jgi:hypothetical protein
MNLLSVAHVCLSLPASPVLLLKYCPPLSCCLLRVCPPPLKDHPFILKGSSFCLTHSETLSCACLAQAAELHNPRGHTAKRCSPLSLGLFVSPSCFWLSLRTSTAHALFLTGVLALCSVSFFFPSLGVCMHVCISMCVSHLVLHLSHRYKHSTCTHTHTQSLSLWAGLRVLPTPKGPSLAPCGLTSRRVACSQVQVPTSLAAGVLHVTQSFL